jgi:hypothetical protein
MDRKGNAGAGRFVHRQTPKQDVPASLAALATVCEAVLSRRHP